jgi:acetoin utilization protein AcuB
MAKKELNILIDEYTSPIAATANVNDSIEDIKKLMKETGFRHIPVIRDGNPIGIISDRDVSLVTSLESFSHLKAMHIMKPDPYCVRLGTSIDAVAFEMSQKKIGSALVLDENGKLDGIFTSIDGLNALIEIVRGE